MGTFFGPPCIMGHVNCGMSLVSCKSLIF